MGTKMVNIYVGAQHQHFRIQHDLLCHQVPYFKIIFPNTTADTNNDFPEDDPACFDVLQEWVYTGKLLPLLAKDLLLLLEPYPLAVPYAPRLLCALAHKLECPDLINQVIDGWILGCKLQEILPTSQEVEEVYAMLPAGSPALS